MARPNHIRDTFLHCEMCGKPLPHGHFKRKRRLCAICSKQLSAMFRRDNNASNARMVR